VETGLASRLSKGDGDGDGDGDSGGGEDGIEQEEEAEEEVVVVVAVVVTMAGSSLGEHTGFILTFFLYNTSLKQKSIQCLQ